MLCLSLMQYAYCTSSTCNQLQNTVTIVCLFAILHLPTELISRGIGLSIKRAGICRNHGPKNGSPETLLRWWVGPTMNLRGEFRVNKRAYTSLSDSFKNPKSCFSFDFKVCFFRGLVLHTVEYSRLVHRPTGCVDSPIFLWYKYITRAHI